MGRAFGLSSAIGPWFEDAEGGARAAKPRSIPAEASMHKHGARLWSFVRNRPVVRRRRRRRTSGEAAKYSRGGIHAQAWGAPLVFRPQSARGSKTPKAAHERQAAGLRGKGMLSFAQKKRENCISFGVWANSAKQLLRKYRICYNGAEFLCCSYGKGEEIWIM